jgi:hypothetical protein
MLNQWVGGLIPPQATGSEGVKAKVAGINELRLAGGPVTGFGRLAADAGEACSVFFLF